MKNFLSVSMILLGLFLFGCEKQDDGGGCPNDMYECEQPDGTTICVPDKSYC